MNHLSQSPWYYNSLSAVSNFSQICEDIRSPSCTAGVKDVASKLTTGVVESGGKVTAGVNDTGGQIVTQIRRVANKKKPEAKISWYCSFNTQWGIPFLIYPPPPTSISWNVRTEPYTDNSEVFLGRIAFDSPLPKGGIISEINIPNHRNQAFGT